MVRREINSEELQVLFTSIGEGIWHLQNVEDALNTYIAVKRDIKVRASMPADQAKAILTKHRKNTLGASLRISREAAVLSPPLQKVLEEFKEERNWLVHRLVYGHREDLYVDDTRFELVGRLKKFSENAILIQKLIAKELEDYVVAQGISRDRVYRDAERVNENETLP
jgi:hypothetical protein